MHTQLNQKNDNTDDVQLQKTDLMELLVSLKHSDERYRIAAENSSEIILDYNLLDDSIYHVTKRVTQMYGLPQFIEHNAPKVLVDSGAIQPESAKAFTEILQQLKEGKLKVQCTLKTRTVSGEIRWAQIILTGISDENGIPSHAIGVLKDITAQHFAEQQYEKELLHRDVMMKEALLYYEADLTNHRILFGIEHILEALKIPYIDNYEYCLGIIFQQLVYPEDRPLMHRVYSISNLLAQYAAGQVKVENEYRRLDPNGNVYWVRGTAYMTEDTENKIIRAYYYVHDINETKMRELKFQQQAERDLLTGLYNKGTAEVLTRGAIEADITSNQLSVYYIVDLDNFKHVNDNLGHAYGDALLSETGQKLQAMCRSGDIAGRIGGDEFTLFLRELGGSSQAEDIAASICNIFHDNTASAIKNHSVTCTVGFAFLPEDGSTFDELYMRADLALYEAKRTGKDGWCRYHTGLEGADRVPLPRAAIDQSTDKTFAGNIMEYVFRILYESQEIKKAIDSVLELVARHFHFERGYVFEASGEGLCLCQYEWFASRSEPLPGTLRMVSIEGIPACQVYMGSDKPLNLTLSEGVQGKICLNPIIQPAPQCIQFALETNGTLQGFLGFDRHEGLHKLSSAEVTTLIGVAQLLDVFLSGKYAADRLAASSTMLQVVTDGLSTLTYVIDPKTHIFQFVNQNTTNVISGAHTGMICYEVMRGRTTPCEDCPFTIMINNGTRSCQTEMYLEPYQMCLKISASLVKLSDGRDYGLFHGFDFT